MAGASNIEWTESTWNPIVGCSIVSPGCTNCYAMRDAWRKHHNPKLVHYHGLTKKVNGHPVWTGVVRQAPEHILLEPLRTRKPTTWFVNSMSDLFHEDVPDEWIVQVLDVIRRTGFDGGSNCGKINGEHTYQVLTKRAARMAAFMPRLRFNPLDDRGLYLSDDGGPSVVMKNLWLGVSAERQKEADERIPHLLQTPAAIRFVSAEPLLGPIDLKYIVREGINGAFIDNALDGFHSNGYGGTYGPKLDWVIVGGESGHGARPMHPDWARSLRDQCDAAGVAFFFKQWGAWANGMPAQSGESGRFALWHEGGCDWSFYDETPRHFGRFGATARMTLVGKKAAGRLLDGKEHNDMPLLPSALAATSNNKSHTEKAERA